MNLNLSQLTSTIIKFRGVAITLLVALVLAYTAYQISLATSVVPDSAYLSAQKDKLATIQLKSDPKTIQAIRNLESPGDTSIPIKLGKSNPFAE